MKKEFSGVIQNTFSENNYTAEDLHAYRYAIKGNKRAAVRM
jgi:hypothetical protein